MLVRIGSASCSSSSLSRFFSFPLLLLLLVFHIISYLPDSDLYSLSVCSKRLLQYSLADSLVWERRLARQFPFNLQLLWRNLIAKRYPAMRMAEAMLTWPEKNAVIRKYIGDTVDKSEKWSIDAFRIFSDAGVIGTTKRDQAIFYLYNVIRNPQLRTPKIVDKVRGFLLVQNECANFVEVGSSLKTQSWFARPFPFLILASVRFLRRCTSFSAMPYRYQ